MSVCRFCGKAGTGQLFGEWVKPTFTDHDKLKLGDIICGDCLFWFDEASAVLAEKTGKDKPQRMRNYTHVIKGGEWIPLSKGDKVRMAELLISFPFPELAAIAESGQKHIVFRAIRNPVGGNAGWVQFEEQRLWLEPERLQSTLKMIESLLIVFSKGEIENGKYLPHRIMQFGIEKWQELEERLKPLRGGLFFQLAIFLAQKKEIESERNGNGFTGDNLAGDRQRVQKQVPPDDLGAIREHRSVSGIHEQPGKIHQLGLFEIR